MSAAKIALLAISFFLTFLSFSTESGAGGIYIPYYLLVMILVLILTAMNHRKIKVKKSYLFVVGFGVGMFILNCIVSKGDLQYGLILLWVMSVGFLLFMNAISDKNNTIIALRIYILVNVAVIFYQFLYTVILGEGIYLHGQIFGFSREKYSLVEFESFFRFSGYHLEPGSYATLVALIILAYQKFSGKIDLIYIVGMLSLILTFSIIGYIFFIILYLNKLSFKHVARKEIASLMLLAVVVFSTSVEMGASNYLIERFSNGLFSDSSTAVKIHNLIFYADQKSSDIIFGNGLEYLADSCSNCDHLKGNGVAFYILYSLGIIPMILFSLILSFVYLKNKEIKYLIIALLIIRYVPIYICFWFLFSLIVHYGFYEKNTFSTA